MKKFFKYALILLAIDILLFLLLALKAAPAPISISECLQVSGTVVSVSSGTMGDLILKLSEDDRQYLIDRALSDEGQTYEKWKANLEGEEVTLYYSNCWTPLDYASNLRQLSLVEIEGEKVWGELGE